MSFCQDLPSAKNSVLKIHPAPKSIKKKSTFMGVIVPAQKHDPTTSNDLVLVPQPVKPVNKNAPQSDYDVTLLDEEIKKLLKIRKQNLTIIESKLNNLKWIAMNSTDPLDKYNAQDS